MRKGKLIGKAIGIALVFVMLTSTLGGLVWARDVDITVWIPATIDFDPDVLNLGSAGKFVTAYIELPTGYDVGQIDISSIRLTGMVPALAKPTQVGDHDNDGVPDLMVKFDKAAVQNALTAGEEVEVTITGQVAGIAFEGSDTIRVITTAARPRLREWTRVATPSEAGWVLAPDSVIIDYAVADGGEVAYAIEYSYDTGQFHLLKSSDAAATWMDITDALEELIDLDEGDYVAELTRVATDGVASDFVAVALWWYDIDSADWYLHVFISGDGGATFEDTGEVEDDGVYLNETCDLAVSPEEDGERDIAIGGTDVSNARIFRCTVIGDSAAAWEDATTDDGWDNRWEDDADASDDIYSDFVVDLLFSPSWAADRTILVLTAAVEDGMDGFVYGDVHLQCGTWGMTEGWNAQSTLAIDAVPIKEDVYLPDFVSYFDFRGIGGIATPTDYSGRNSDGRYAWVWVNYYDPVEDEAVGEILRVRNTSVVPVNQQIEGMPWLTNVSYWGTIASGKAIAGVLGTGAYYVEDGPWDLITECCEGVQVYRNDGVNNMDICCIFWKQACKPPTGRAAMAVSYVTADKAYAVALQGFLDYDEGAWSVSFDDGDTWNQLSLIDTHISLLTDVAVSPDCNKTMLVSINYGPEWNGNGEYCYCDSVWLHAENLPEAPEYSGQWLRTWCGQLDGMREGDYPLGAGVKWGLLRLAPEETDGSTVYLVDVGTDTVYWNDMETLACWNRGTAPIDNIADLAVKDRETIYALDYSGAVAMSDDYTIGWHTAVESEVEAGWTIAVWGDDILVGGQEGDVSHSADGGGTFTELEKVGADGLVTVALDSYFDANDTIYAAVAAWDEIEDETTGGIFRWVLDESTTWYDLGADPDYAYTGLVLDNADGNPMTSADTGGVLYASYYYYDEYYDQGYTGVARYLTPGEDVICKECDEWDYLEQGLTSELFIMVPQALRICGCLTADTNSKLFAIGFEDVEESFYDMAEGTWGTVWMFEDCYGKGGSRHQSSR